MKVRSQHASTRSHCPSLPLLRPCWLASSLTAGGNVSRLRLGMLSFCSRPPAKFGEDSIVGTKKCFCFLCSTARRSIRQLCLSLSLSAELLLLLFAAALRRHHGRSEHITKASGKLLNELNGP